MEDLHDYCKTVHDCTDYLHEFRGQGSNYSMIQIRSEEIAKLQVELKKTGNWINGYACAVYDVFITLNCGEFFKLEDVLSYSDDYGKPYTLKIRE